MDEWETGFTCTSVKVFDKVLQGRLIQMIKGQRIRGMLVSYIQNWLSDKEGNDRGFFSLSENWLINIKVSR